MQPTHEETNTQSTAVRKNHDIWDALYRQGMFLAYPSEVFVRLYNRHGRSRLRSGCTFLDHGAGSGNNTEFLIRQGHRVTATDISPTALEIIHQRFTFTNLPAPQTLLVDPAAPLAEQLPASDAILAWDSVCYNTREGAISTIATLLSRLDETGLLFINMPSPAHDFVTKAEQIAPGTYRFRGEQGAQEGAIMTAPASIDELIEWCGDVEVLASGTFGSVTDDFRSDFMYVVVSPASR